MKKILLIEDDADLFSLLKYNLEKEGFSLNGLQTGKGAIELCRQVRPDLILLDIMLPDSDGLDICKGIRKDTDLAGIRDAAVLTKLPAEECAACERLWADVAALLKKVDDKAAQE